jgi:photosystem II protein PsbQ
MARYRSILAFVLVIITTFLVSCGGPAKVTGPTYSSAQLEQIQRYSDSVASLGDRMSSELLPLIEQEQWNDVESFIHGPLGELRTRMSRLARTLEPKAQKGALAAAQEVFEHLIKIDEAAQARDFAKASSNYGAALRDLDTFLQLMPS